MNEIGAQETVQEEHKTLSVSTSFPAERLWFPLKLASMYGDDVIPARLFVCGTVRPRTFAGIEPFVRTLTMVRASFEWWTDRPHSHFDCPDEGGLFTRGRPPVWFALLGLTNLLTLVASRPPRRCFA